MTSGGYSIGFKELYDLITEVSRKLDTLSTSHSQQIGANAERIETMSKAMKLMWKKVEDTKQSSWQVNLAIATSGISLLTALATIVIK